MRILLLPILIAVVILTTACPQGPSKQFPNTKNSKSLVQNINEYLTKVQKSFDDAIVKDPTDTTGEARRIRNDALDSVLAVIDDNYTNYISDIETRRSSTDFVLDVIDLGTGVATGITKGERPNQILGIALTGFRGGRRSAELSFYKQQTTPILITKMDDNRANVLADILEKRSETGANYSMKAAIRDMVNYYNAGTLVRAFTELSKSTAALAQASQARVRTLSGPVKISSIPSMDVDQVLRQINAQEIRLAKQIKDAQTANPLAASTASASVAAAARAARQKALQPVRLQLEAIWKRIVSNDKLDAAVDRVKSDTTLGPIITRIDSDPTSVTEENYLSLLFAVQGALDKDLDLNRELLAILTSVSQ